MKRAEKFALCRFLDRINIFDDYDAELLDPYSDTLYRAMLQLLKELHLDLGDLHKFYLDCGGKRDVRK